MKLVETIFGIFIFKIYLEVLTKIDNEKYCTIFRKNKNSDCVNLRSIHLL